MSDSLIILASASEGYVAGWGTLSLINAGLAQGKNRSGLNWFLLSLLGGPIATFALVVFFEKRPAKQTPQSSKA